jgi:hypothetical protein
MEERRNRYRIEKGPLQLWRAFLLGNRNRKSEGEIAEIMGCGRFWKRRWAGRAHYMACF